MPLYWQFDSRRRLVAAVADADVTIGDLDAYLDAVVGVGALGWRKLFDARDAKVALSPEEVLALGVRIRGLHLLGTVGPLAFVLPKAEADGILRLLGFMAAADRQMRVFKAMGPARRWIEAWPISVSREFPQPPLLKG